MYQNLPEHKLLVNMISQAINDIIITTHTRENADERVNAMKWVFDEESEDSFSFNFCCEMLGLDSDHIRKGISQKIKRKKKIRFQLIRAA